jgi:gamma-glutamylcyclotransferase (GGCT)/AIG2-like uncharacterized protein YtfP
MSLPLFVFGTLRRGHVNHHYLEGRYASMIPAELHGYARLHPLMIAPAAGGIVDGELYTLDPARYAETLAGCDELEELVPGTLCGPEYERREVEVLTENGSVTTWAYVQVRC